MEMSFSLKKYTDIFDKFLAKIMNGQCPLDINLDKNKIK